MLKRFTSLIAAIIIVIGMISCEKSEGTNANLSSSSKNFADSKELVEFNKQFISEVTSQDLKAILDGDDEYYLLDVRTGKEFSKSYIPGSVSVPRGVLEFRIASEDVWDDEGLYMPEKDSKIVIYCKKGSRGTLAAKSLIDMGYTNVLNLSGGFTQWKTDFPTEVYENVAPVSAGAAQAGAAEEDSGGC